MTGIPKAAKIAVIGGGPAGSTAATLLAKEGHHVDLLERAKFPR
jgi:2-polyprenyl-6-methoxyphenol hydroxylase-like FAD-dependent oxidoreductase